jgi:hypothetical protein
VAANGLGLLVNMVVVEGRRVCRVRATMTVANLSLEPEVRVRTSLEGLERSACESTPERPLKRTDIVVPVAVCCCCYYCCEITLAQRAPQTTYGEQERRKLPRKFLHCKTFVSIPFYQLSYFCLLCHNALYCTIHCMLFIQYFQKDRANQKTHPHHRLRSCRGSVDPTYQTPLRDLNRECNHGSQSHTRC